MEHQVFIYRVIKKWTYLILKMRWDCLRKCSKLHPTWCDRNFYHKRRSGCNFEAWFEAINNARIHRFFFQKKAQEISHKRTTKISQERPRFCPKKAQISANSGPGTGPKLGSAQPRTGPRQPQNGPRTAFGPSQQPGKAKPSHHMAFMVGGLVWSCI